MKEYQEVLMTLLKEFQGICREQDLRYYAARSLAEIAYFDGGFPDERADLILLMPAADLKRFVEYCETHPREGRYIESMHNSGKFPRLGARYGDRNSLDFDSRNWYRYRYHGVHLTIDPLRQRESGKYAGKINEGLEFAWETYCNHRNDMPKRCTAYRWMSRMVRLRGAEATARRLFDRLLSGKGEGKRLFVKRYWDRQREYLPASYFAKSETLAFEDVQLPVPGGFLKELKAERQPERRPEEINPSLRLVDPQLHAEEYLQALQEEGVDLAALEAQREELREENRPLASLLPKRRRAWDKLFCAGDRYTVYAHYRGRRKELKDLYEKKDVEGLAEAMGFYLEILEEYTEREVAPYVDEDLSRYALYVLECSDRKAEAKALREIFEGMDKTPIRLRDYKGEPLPQEEE